LPEVKKDVFWQNVNKNVKIENVLSLFEKNYYVFIKI